MVFDTRAAEKRHVVYLGNYSEVQGQAIVAVSPYTLEDVLVLHIFVDADACPVKQEVYRVAARYQLKVTLVANAYMKIPNEEWLTLEIVGNETDAADDWIAEKAQARDIVITSDIPLADRCLKKEAHVLGPKGKPFTQANIGQALATREILSELRGAGEMTGGPAPLQKNDKSRFLQELDKTINAIKRKYARRGQMSQESTQ